MHSENDGLNRMFGMRSKKEFEVTDKEDKKGYNFMYIDI